MKIAHVINPVNAATDSELSRIQPVTLESIRLAHQFAKSSAQIELYTVSYPEDHEIIPSFFKPLPDLQRSVLDYGKFTRPRKYPLMADIFKAAFEGSDAEFLLYTNMDINLMPQFYDAVLALLSQGYDALLINRRGVDTKYKSTDDLPLMYSDFGKPHPGFDCFIIHRNLVAKLQLENICIGVPFSEVALVHNLIAFAGKLKLIDDMHLTFHIGTEVMPPVDTEYYLHNRREFEQKIYPRLRPHLKIENFPYRSLPFRMRMLKWMLNPVFRTHQVAEMEGKSFLRRLKYALDEIRFELLDRIR